MRKFTILFAVLLVVFLITTGNVFAARGDREELNFGYVKAMSTNTDGVLADSPTYIYAVTIYPAAANSYVLLYDNATLAGSLANGKVSIEVGEAVQYTTKREVFDPPILMEKGVYADLTSGHVVVEYR